MFGFRNKNADKEVSITVSNRTVIRVILLAVAAVVAVGAIRQASHALLLLFTAFFLALALNAPVHWFARHLPAKQRGNRSLATAVSFLVVILLLAGFLFSIVPPLIQQTSKFISAAPGFVQDAKNENSDIGRFIKRYNLESQVESFSGQISERLKGAGGAAIGTVSKVGSSVFTVLTVLVLTFMMLIEGPRWFRLVKDMIPDEHHAHVEKLAHDMYRVVKGYVNGQVFLAALAAAFILPVMIILGVNYAIALAFIVFICGLIPMVGHTIGAVIVSLVALFTSPISALILLGYYFLYQQIENYLVQPRIQSNSTNMSPLLVFSSVIIGVNFGGIFGGLVAIPVAGCVRILALDYLKRKKIIKTHTYKAAVGKHVAKDVA